MKCSQCGEPMKSPFMIVTARGSSSGFVMVVQNVEEYHGKLSDAVVCGKRCFMACVDSLIDEHVLSIKRAAHMASGHASVLVCVVAALFCLAAYWTGITQHNARHEATERYVCEELMTEAQALMVSVEEVNGRVRSIKGGTHGPEQLFLGRKPMLPWDEPGLQGMLDIRARAGSLPGYGKGGR